MSKRFMPQRLFHFGAASIAKIHLLTGKPIPELAALAFARYREAYVDDANERDWALAAKLAVELLREKNAPAPDQLLNHFQYFVENYHPDGRPRKKRLFQGTFFTKEDQNPRRKEEFLALLESYYVGAQAGIVPLAPPGWPERS